MSFLNRLIGTVFGSDAKVPRVRTENGSPRPGTCARSAWKPWKGVS